MRIAREFKYIGHLKLIKGGEKMVFLLLPGFQPLAFIIAVGSFLWTLIPGVQPVAAWVFAVAF